MGAIHCVGFLFFVLVIGISLGTLGLRLAFIIVTPLFILWFISWDGKHHTRTRRQQQTEYVCHELP